MTDEYISQETISRLLAQGALGAYEARLARALYEAREELAILQEVQIRGCDCSEDDACAFARERDEAIRSRDALVRVIREARGDESRG